MKIDWEDFHEIEVNKLHPSDGQVRLLAQKDVEVWAGPFNAHETITEDGEVIKTEPLLKLVGIGRDINVDLMRPMAIKVVGDESIRVFMHQRVILLFKEERENYLNADRMPDPGDEFEGSMRLRRLAEMTERRNLAAERMRQKRKEDADRAEDERVAKEKAAADASEAERKRLEAEEDDEKPA